MPSRLQPRRRDEIIDASLDLLRLGGLPAVTTAALASRARCSKNTLYELFEDRNAILAALVERQASSLNAAIEEADPRIPARDNLVRAGAQLLVLLTSEASLVINRAALADPSGQLSRILIETGKQRSTPRIAALIERLHEEGSLMVPDLEQSYRDFYGLLIADRQILGLHGALEPAPSQDDALAVARRAVGLLMLIYTPARS